MSLRVIAGATLLALVATDAAAQSGTSVSGTLLRHMGQRQ